MNNSTSKDLPDSKSLVSSPVPGEKEFPMPENGRPEDGVPSDAQCLSMLNNLNFSPRKSTVEAILQYSRRKEEAMH